MANEDIAQPWTIGAAPLPSFMSAIPDYIITLRRKHSMELLEAMASHQEQVTHDLTIDGRVEHQSVTTVYESKQADTDDLSRVLTKLDSLISADKRRADVDLQERLSKMREFDSFSLVKSNMTVNKRSEDDKSDKSSQKPKSFKRQVQRKYNGGQPAPKKQNTYNRPYCFS